jgi:hypothetical protein
MSNEPFKIDVANLKRQPKTADREKLEAVDEAGENLGFVDRTPQKKRGRRPSPRTGQVHAKVMPNVSNEIANEARRRGIQQGVLIEEAWKLYKNGNGL